MTRMKNSGTADVIINTSAVETHGTTRGRAQYIPGSGT